MKKTLWNDTRASSNIGAVIVTALIGIFTIIVVYALLYEVVCVTIYNVAVTMAPPNTAGAYFITIGLVRTMFNIAPWILIFGILLWAYLSAQKEEYEHGY